MTRTRLIEDTARTCARWWSRRLEQGDWDPLLFRVSLKNQLLWALTEGRSEHPQGFVRVSVDHDPDALLLRALHGAGIECRGVLFSAHRVLPSKTQMRVYDNGQIEVSEGYGAEWLEVSSIE